MSRPQHLPLGEEAGYNIGPLGKVNVKATASALGGRRQVTILALWGKYNVNGRATTSAQLGESK
jgi:hypothetical protein